MSQVSPVNEEIDELKLIENQTSVRGIARPILAVEKIGIKTTPENEIYMIEWRVPGYNMTPVGPVITDVELFARVTSRAKQVTSSWKKIGSAKIKYDYYKKIFIPIRVSGFDTLKFSYQVVLRTININKTLGPFSNPCIIE